MNYSHPSVMLEEAVDYLSLRPHGIYVDATFGGGGHTRAILRAEPTCRVIACDWDNDALELNGPALEAEFPGRVTLLWTNFARIAEKLRTHDIAAVHGILADFGTSRYQIETKAGLSFMRDAPLDMRMSAAHHKITAYDILHNSSEAELVHILGVYGGEQHARRIARAIMAARTRKEPLKTTYDLANIITRVSPARVGGIHPATKTFQALRIVVNKELENIESLMAQAPRILTPGGRCVCISFHSLEDRIVKHAFQEQRDVWNIITRQVVVPTEAEVAHNPSARSARLRCAERK